jgi:hypothetical protein
MHLPAVRRPSNLTEVRRWLSRRAAFGASRHSEFGPGVLSAKARHPYFIQHRTRGQRLTTRNSTLMAVWLAMIE